MTEFEQIMAKLDLILYHLGVTDTGEIGEPDPVTPTPEPVVVPPVVTPPVVTPPVVTPPVVAPPVVAPPVVAPPVVVPSVRRKPGKVFDLSHWYLTLPIANPTDRSDTGPWDVYQPALDTFEHQTFWRINDADELEVYAPVDGVTTSAASGATRTEGREEDGKGGHASWGFNDGKEHTLTVTMACDPTSVAGRKEAIVGQIHDETDVPPIYLAVNHNTSPGILRLFVNGPGRANLLTGLLPTDVFTYRIQVKGGYCNIYAAEGDVSKLPASPQISLPASTFRNQVANCYFKAPVYNKEPISGSKIGGTSGRVLRWDLVQGSYVSKAPSVATVRRTHLVVSGDTLAKLANAYGTTVANIQAWNGLGTSTIIRVGQTLTVSA